MLNLLIAIISESFAHINDNSSNASYQERACLISENSYLIPAYRKDAFCPTKQYMAVAQDIKEVKQIEEETEDQKVEERLAKVEETVNKILEKV